MVSIRSAKGINNVKPRDGTSRMGTKKTACVQQHFVPSNLPAHCVEVADIFLSGDGEEENHCVKVFRKY